MKIVQEGSRGEQGESCKSLHIFLYRQLDFSSEPGVANEILENEPKSCLSVA